MTLPDQDRIRELLDWEPPHGVLSVYLRVDHGDRGDGWRIALGDAVRDAVREAPADGHDRKQALRATAERMLDRFPEDHPPDGRGQVGIVEISREPGREQWWETQAAPRATMARIAPRPHLKPLVEMLDEHRPIGVIAVSGEHARLLEWREVELREVSASEILTTGDWREQKAQRPVDPARGQAPSSSGRDQYDARVEDARRRFIDEVAGSVEATRSERGWDQLVAFGEAKYLSELRERLAPTEPDHCEEKNLLTEPERTISERMGELVPQLNRARELALIERVEEAARAGGRGSLGLQETAQALVQGRVEHLLIDSAGAFSADDLAGALSLGDASPDAPPGELMVEHALRTGASVTPVEEEAAAKLDRHGGVAALLRY